MGLEMAIIKFLFKKVVDIQSMGWLYGAGFLISYIVILLINTKILKTSILIVALHLFWVLFNHSLIFLRIVQILILI